MTDTDTFAIQVTHTVTAQFLWDVMTTMVESHYEWFAFGDVKRHKGEDHSGVALSFSAEEIDDDDGEVLGETSIDTSKIVAAMTRIAAGGLTHDGHRDTVAGACASNDASDIDMDVADCILQVACFGEIRYG